MNWNFSAWAIRNPVPPIVLFVVLCFLGLVSFAKLPVTRFPTVDVPVRSKVGAGDSLVGGFVLGLARGYNLERAAALGVAASTSAVSLRSLTTQPTAKRRSASYHQR